MAPFLLDGWQVDPVGSRISNETESKRIEPKTMAVLCRLASRAGAVVTRLELEESVWAGSIVGYDALSNTIIKLRKAFGDSASDPRIIETIAKSGYRLIAEVGEVNDSALTGKGSAEVAVEAARKLRHNAANWRQNFSIGAVAIVVALSLGYVLIYDHTNGISVPTGPRIALIPFKDLSDNQQDSFFSDGLTRDINAQLSKFSNLFVIAPSSVRGFVEDTNCEEVRDELQADYILEGTVRRSEKDLRVTTTFTDAKTCRQLDAPGPFDRDLNVAGVLDVQLEIAKIVVAQIGSADAPLFNTQVQSEIRHKAPDSLLAYECVLLSYWFYETFEADRQRKARACLEQAVKIDPDYSLAWSRLAFSYIETKKYAIDTPADWAELARNAANRAIALDPDNPDAYYALAILTRMTSQDLVEFENFADRTVSLNPNDAFVLADLGTWMGYAGQWEQGKEWVARSMILNPKHQSWLHQIWHLDHYRRGEYKESRDMALKMNLPNNYMVQASLSAAYAMNGEQENAEQTLKKVIALKSNYADDPRAPFRARGMPAEFIENLMDGLRKAGLEVKPLETVN